MKKHIYLYNHPFLFTDSPGARARYLLDYFGDEDRRDVKQINQLLMKFAAEEALIEIIDNQICSSRKEETGSWIYMVNWMNFRSLVDKTRYGALMSALQSSHHHPVDAIINLHSRLGSLFDERLLNTLVNRTMTSIAIVPYDLRNKDDRISWTKIHTETPFIWLVIAIQNIIRSEAKIIGL